VRGWEFLGTPLHYSTRKRGAQGGHVKSKGKATPRVGKSGAKGAKKRPRRKPGGGRGRWVWRVARTLLLLGLIGALVSAGLMYAVLWHYAQDLPEIFSFADYKPKQVTRIYDRHGNVLAELFDERRSVVPLEEIPEVMRYAIIAAEDAAFYEHKGLDYFGVVRATYVNIRRGSFSQGSSTITQQVVKNLLLTPEKEIRRKIQEVLLARQLESALTKDEILTIYLNHIYFGHRTHGIEEASRFYFGKRARELSLNEAATLAGIVQSPERLSPAKHPERARERRNYVLRQMRDKGFITEAAYATTLEAPIEVRREAPSSLGQAPHFTEHVRRTLVNLYGEAYVYTAGLDVYTTVDLSLQSAAEDALREGLQAYDARVGLYQPLKGAKVRPDHETKRVLKGQRYRAEVASVGGDAVEVRLGEWVVPLRLVPRARVLRGQSVEERFHVGEIWWVEVADLGVDGSPLSFQPAHSAEGALVAIDPASREVVAMVGGYDYQTSVFNRAAQALRQTGSSFKPFVYGAALEAKIISAATVIDDAPKVFHIPGKREPWSPKNFDNKFKGPMRVRQALAESRNTIAVDVLERVGIGAAIDFSRRIGVSSKLVDNFTLALGSSEMTALEATNAFATFASGGIFQEPIFVWRISRRDGTILHEAPRTGRRVIGEDVAFVMTSMLRSVVTEGTAKRTLGDWKVYSVGKTGTSNGPNDAWYVGYSPRLACGVYVGYDQPRDLGSGEGGGKTALPIWSVFMRKAHEGLEVVAPTPPSGVLEARIDRASGLLAQGTEGAMTEYFLAGTVPAQSAPSRGELSAADWMMREIGQGTSAQPAPASGGDGAPLDDGF